MFVKKLYNTYAQIFVCKLSDASNAKNNYDRL